jgi:AraC-like DNA-binding protein
MNFWKPLKGGEQTDLFLLNLELVVEPLKKIADIYRQTNPEYFKEYKDKMGRVNEHFSPELVSIIKAEILSIPEAPEGWKTDNAVFDALGIRPSAIKKDIDVYRQKNPEYFEEFKNKGFTREHYSPELVSIITEKAEKIQQITEAPEGWKTKKSLTAELGSNHDKIKGIVNKYRETSPEYFKDFKSSVGPIREHYSPELIELIKKELEQFAAIPEAPDGWETLTSLSQGLGHSKNKILNIVSKYRESNPEYFKEYKDKIGRIPEHYSPELITVIKKELEQFAAIPEAPEGWKTNAAISDDLGVAERTIKRISTSYLETNPEYFKEYKDKTKKISMHYSPELIAIIAKEIGQNNEAPEAPESWQTTQHISERTGISKEEVEKMAKKLRQQHKDQFGKFKGKE